MLQVEIEKVKVFILPRHIYKKYFMPSLNKESQLKRFVFDIRLLPANMS